jgi:hypothetical protein
MENAKYYIEIIAAFTMVMGVAGVIRHRISLNS